MEVSEELKKFRDEYAKNLDYNNPKLFFLLLDKLNNSTELEA